MVAVPCFCCARRCELAKSRPLPLLRFGCFCRRQRLSCAVPHAWEAEPKGYVLAPTFTGELSSEARLRGHKSGPFCCNRTAKGAVFATIFRGQISNLLIVQQGLEFQDAGDGLGVLDLAREDHLAGFGQGDALGGQEFVGV